MKFLVVALGLTLAPSLAFAQSAQFWYDQAANAAAPPTPAAPFDPLPSAHDDYMGVPVPAGPSEETQRLQLDLDTVRAQRDYDEASRPYGSDDGH